MNKDGFLSSFSKLLPILSTLLLLLFSYTPFSFVFSNSIKPLLALICVFFWLTHRPDIFNIISVLIVALVSDVISSAPFGSNILMFWVLYALTNKFQKFFYAKPFVIYWYGFMAFSLAAILTKWFVLSIYYGQFLPLVPTFFMYLTTIVFYPFISILNAVIQGYVRFEDE